MPLVVDQLGRPINLRTSTAETWDCVFDALDDAQAREMLGRAHIELVIEEFSFAEGARLDHRARLNRLRATSAGPPAPVVVRLDGVGNAPGSGVSHDEDLQQPPSAGALVDALAEALVDHTMGVAATPSDSAAHDAVDRSTREPVTGARSSSRQGDGFVRLSDVEEREVEWLWDRRLARANVVVLAGDGGIGKSTLAQEIGARITRGQALPGGSSDRPRGVLILTAEEDASAVVRPRMRLMGADLDRVMILDPDQAGMTFPSGAPTLEARCLTEDVGLVVIDTGPAFLDRNLSSNAEEDVRRFLAPLRLVAERQRLVVIVLCHLNKAAGMDARRRVMGGAAWVNAPRQVLVVGPPPGVDPRESGERLVAVEKNNLGPYPPAVAFRLAPAQNDPSRAVVAWGGEVDGVRPCDLVQAPPNEEDRAENAEAADVLLEILDAGPMSAREFEREAREAGVSRHRFEAARAALKREGKIESIQEPRPGGGAARWRWRRTDHTPPVPPGGSVPGGVCNPSIDAGFSGSTVHTPPSHVNGGSVLPSRVSPDDLARWEALALDGIEGAS